MPTGMIKRLPITILTLVTLFAIMEAGSQALGISLSIDVPSDYSSIQEAVNAASPGDTVQVSSGTYHESIIIDKPISLIGEGKENTIIEGVGTGDVIRISSDRVMISGFTIKNSGSRYAGPFKEGDSGVELSNVKNCTVSNLFVSRNTHGISLVSSENNIIENNVVFLNSAEGIFLIRESDNNLIVNNVCNSNGSHGGIWVAHSSSNLIINNVANHNPDHGIKLHTTENNIVENNVCLANGSSGIYLLNVNNTIVKNNRCSHNVGVGGVEVPRGVKWSGKGMHLEGNNTKIINNICDGNAISGMEIKATKILEKSRNNLIANNSFSNNGIFGLMLWNVDNNLIENNVIKSNHMLRRYLRRYPPPPIKREPIFAGIVLVRNSSYNKVFHNIVSLNKDGIRVRRLVGSKNKINKNDIEGNTRYGILSKDKVLTEIDATNNWWGDPSGPYHSELNLDGKGDEVKGNVVFEPWLDEPVTRVTERAKFSVSNLSVSKATIKPGEITIISVKVKNVGRAKGTYRVELLIKDKVVDSKSITLAPREFREVSFSVARKEEGTYRVEIGDLTGSFEVKKPPKPKRPRRGIPLFLIIGGSVAAIAIGVGIMAYVRRK